MEYLMIFWKCVDFW